MAVSDSARWRSWSALAGLLAALPGVAWASAPNSVGVDLYFFGQRDPGTGTAFVGGPEKRGGNPLRAEGFDYGAGGVDFRFSLDDEVALRGNAVVGWISDEGEAPIPNSVPDAVTSASPSVVTLDSQVNVDWRLDGGDWQIAPGFFYHHQTKFFVGGPSLDLARSLFGGDTVLFTNTSLRAALIRQHNWADVPMGEDWRTSFNTLVGWTQTWSPSLLTTVSARYSRQAGLLHSRWNYVGIYDTDGRVVDLVDEQLPRLRHRGQVTLRGRYSWTRGWSVGLDTSAYADDWKVLHASVEGSLEAEIVSRFSVRVWYRVSRQSATEFFREAPTALGRFFTQDSDLGRFVAHSPGLLVNVPIQGALPWTLQASLYGMYRSDGLFTAGSHAGVRASW